MNYSVIKQEEQTKPDPDADFVGGEEDYGYDESVGNTDEEEEEHCRWNYISIMPVEISFI